jgi:hypothetical protein
MRGRVMLTARGRQQRHERAPSSVRSGVREFRAWPRYDRKDAAGKHNPHLCWPDAASTPQGYRAFRIPALHQQRWRTVEVVIGGCTDTLTRPNALLLGRYDHRGRLHYLITDTPPDPSAATRAGRPTHTHRPARPRPPSLAITAAGDLVACLRRPAAAAPTSKCSRPWSPRSRSTPPPARPAGHDTSPTTYVYDPALRPSWPPTGAYGLDGRAEEMISTPVRVQ